MRHPAFALFLAVGLVLGASVTDSVAQSGGGRFLGENERPGKTNRRLYTTAMRGLAGISAALTSM